MAGYRYQVSITKQPDTGLFRVTWLDMEKCIETFFEVPDPQVMEDRLKSWKKPGNRLAAGRELFHFLDGTQGYFSSLLKKAADENLFPLVYLTAGRESGDWPFELIARGIISWYPRRCTWCAVCPNAGLMPDQSRETGGIFMRRSCIMGL
jgi:hypothetical protein